MKPSMPKNLFLRVQHTNNQHLLVEIISFKRIVHPKSSILVFSPMQLHLMRSEMFKLQKSIIKGVQMSHSESYYRGTVVTLTLALFKSSRDA